MSIILLFGESDCYRNDETSLSFISLAGETGEGGEGGGGWGWARRG